MAIRYDKKLNAEMNRIIKNYNQKIARLEKQEKDFLLPTKISKRELKENVYTRTELRRRLKELQRFSTRGMEETIKTPTGLELSKYEYVNLKKESARVKRQLTRDIKRLETTIPTVFGKQQSATFAQMGDSQYLNLVARRKALEKGELLNLSPDVFRQYKKLLEKSGRSKVYYDNIFKENYIDMLTDTAYRVGYDREKLELLKSKLMKLNSKDFLRLFQNEKAIGAILDYYMVSQANFGNIEDIEEDITNLYDNLIDNIDQIIGG